MLTHEFSFFAFSNSLPHPATGVWASSCVVLSFWMGLNHDNFRKKKKCLCSKKYIFGLPYIPASIKTHHGRKELFLRMQCLLTFTRATTGHQIGYGKLFRGIHNGMSDLAITLLNSQTKDSLLNDKLANAVEINRSPPGYSKWMCYYNVSIISRNHVTIPAK